MNRTDFEIIEALQNNARLSNKELAAHVGLAPSSCSERTRKLQEEGYFEGFHARVNPEKVGIGLQAMISIRLAHHTHNEVEGFRDYACSIHEVIRIFHVAGSEDFLVHVAVKDANHLRNLAMNAFTTRPEVAHIQTSLIFEMVDKAKYPLFTEFDS